MKMLLSLAFLTSGTVFADNNESGFNDSESHRRPYRYNFRVKCKYADDGDAILWEDYFRHYSDAVDAAHDCCRERAAKKANIYNRSGDRISKVDC